MHLSQHHFQLRDRYFESSGAFALSSLFFKAYGLVGLELDDEALLNGTVKLIHARGVLPDGLTFSFPDDPLPNPLDIGDAFSPTRESHLVLLTIPAYRPSGANCVPEAAPPDGDRRFLAEAAEVRDDTTGQDEKRVTLGRKNFRLALDGEGPAEAVSLPLARVRRDRSGDFVYDRSYIPPCLQIGASRPILQMLHRLIEVMEAKASSLASERTQGESAADFASEEVASFWLAHAIHSSLATLRHQLEIKSSHPEEVYAELLRLGGALCTFSIDSSPLGLPLYDHDDLEGSFGPLDSHIRSHMEVVLPRGAIRVDLKRTKEFFYTGKTPDPRNLRGAHWFLEVKVAGSRERVIADVPRLVKVCATRLLDRLVQTAHSGLTLEHVPSPPADIAPRIGAEYFRIATAGPCWAAIVEADEATAIGDVGVYVPEALSELDLKIVIAPAE
jgi:type VI secretion system protein ImpJ